MPSSAKLKLAVAANYAAIAVSYLACLTIRIATKQHPDLVDYRVSHKRLLLSICGISPLLGKLHN